MMKRLAFVFAILFALCVSAYTQGDREALASIDGDGGGTRERTVPSTLPDAEWYKPNVSGKPYGISSMVGLPNKEGRTELLVAHDDDSDRGPRLGILTVEPNRVDYRSLNWLPKDNLQLDLEAISAVPDQPGQFLALSSDGHLFLLKVSGENATVVTDFMLTDFMPRPLPLPRVNIEGLSVQKLSGQIVITWGHRGGGKGQGDEQPGILYYGLLDLKNKKITGVGKPESIKVNYPSPNDPNTRHIADLRVDAGGVVWASATNDPCDSCQFISGVYRLGVLSVSETSGTLEVHFKLEIDQQPRWTCAKKLEAIELVPGTDTGFAFGSEDEDNGGWLYFKRAKDVGHVKHEGLL